MSPVVPPVQNALFGPPPDLDPTQCESIPAFKETVPPGHNLDGATFVVVSWKPSPEDLKTLNEGGLVHISMLGGLAPHFLTTSFSQATYGRIILE